MASDKKDGASQTIAKAKVERRGFLKALGLGAGAAAAGVSADAGLTPAAAQESRNDRTKARYKADSAHVQAFYRTNRY
jgi:anaerobic selenocysteine-containing dehydrogenase